MIGRGTFGVEISTSAPDSDDAAFLGVAFFHRIGSYAFSIGLGFTEVPSGEGLSLPCDLPQCHVSVSPGGSDTTRIVAKIPPNITTEWVVAVRGIGTKVTLRSPKWTTKRNDVGVHFRGAFDGGGARVRPPGQPAVEAFRGISAVSATKGRSFAIAQLPCDESGEGSATFRDTKSGSGQLLVCPKEILKGAYAGVANSWELTGQVLGGTTNSYVRLLVLDIPPT